MRSIFFVACLAASFGASAPSLAQPSKPPAARPQSDAKTDQARELHIKGAALYEQGQYDKAEAAFLAAWALKKHYQVASNLGACEMKLAKYRDAAEHFAFFLREQPKTGNQEDRKRTQELFNEARAKVGTLVLNVNVAGALVSIDGHEIGTAPLAAELYVDPGTRTLVASHSDYKDARKVINAKAGGTETVTLTLSPPDLPPPPIPPERKPEVPVVPEKRSPVPAIVAGGFAVGAAAVGVGLLVAASGKDREMAELDAVIVVQERQGCAATGPMHPRCTELGGIARDGDTFQNVAIGAFIGAGVLAAGAVTYLLWPAPKMKRGKIDVHAAPVVGAGHGGLIIQGAF